jgi:hypothetical protein
MTETAIVDVARKASIREIKFRFGQLKIAEVLAGPLPSND